MAGFGRMVNSTPGLVLVLAVTTLIGALIFQRIESPHEQHTRIHVSKIRQKIFVLAQQLSRKGGNADWSKLVAQVDRYRDRLLASWQAGTDELTIDFPNKWSIWGSIYYCFTVFTTIGFGDIFATTTFGKLLTIIYGLLVIPLCSLLISRISSIMVRFLKAIYLMTLDASGVPIGFRETYQRTDASYNFRVLPCLLLFSVYLLLGAVVYSYIARGQTQHWNILDAIYFAFITTSTVGFGDLVPDTDTFFAFLSLLYMIIGLAVTGVVFGRLTMIYDQLFHWIDQPVGQSAHDGRPLKDSTGRSISHTVGKHSKQN